jgi:general secretion pathway protein J
VTGQAYSRHLNSHLDEGDAGFTLVEMLAALVLMTLVSTLIFGGISFGARIWEKGNSITETWREISVARHFLNQHLSRIYPEYLDPVLDLERVTFSGKQNEMLYSAPLPSRLETGGNQRFALYLDDDGTRRDLRLDWVFDDQLNDPRDSSDVTSVTLISGLRQVQFSYVDEEGEVSNTWFRLNKLPTKIRIDAEKEGKSDFVWPTLIVKPMVQVDVECVYDPVTRGCRGRYE